MAAHNTFVFNPEVPLTEEWRWTTDIQVSRNRSEVTIPLNKAPKRTFRGSYAFDSLTDLRYHIAAIYASTDTLFNFPLWSSAAIITASVVGGSDDTITVNAHRTDLREGNQAFIVQGDTFESAEVLTVNATSIVFTSNLVNSYSYGARVMPLVKGIARANNTVQRATVDGSAVASFEVLERNPWLPFVSPLNSETLTMFDSLPVLERVPIGSGFATEYETGLTLNEAIGLPNIESPWLHNRLNFPLQFLCNKVRDYTDWYWWVKFADGVKGSANTFLFPTNRQDFELHTAASGADDRFTITDTEYSDHYEGDPAFSRVVITSDAGTHYATVTNVTQSGGRDTIIFSPDTPAGAWETNQKISLLLECRIADDLITCEHHDYYTLMNLAIRTAGL